MQHEQLKKVMGKKCTLQWNMPSIWANFAHTGKVEGMLRIVVLEHSIIIYIGGIFYEKSINKT